MVDYDVIVLGAGFYGVKIALELHNSGLKVAIADPHGLLHMATQVNQGRVHSGMHYPRFFQTALSAAKHYNRFLTEHAEVIVPNDRHIYAIAHDSKTSPKEFETVAREVGAPIRQIDIPTLFAPQMVQSAYEVNEVSFDVKKLRNMLDWQLTLAKIPVIYSAGNIVDIQENWIEVKMVDCFKTYRASYVFNCTYGNLDSVVPLKTRIKKEWAEVAICKVPPQLHDTDITIMDGLYWSLMKYPPEVNAHALTHVKYTPHHEWFGGESPITLETHTNWTHMRKEAIDFVPLMRLAEYSHSLWTVRTVLAENEENDGRPILWEYHPDTPRIVSVLGSKFNAIYDALDELKRGEWMKHAQKTGVKRVGRRALVGHTGFVGSNLVAPGRFTDYSNSTKPLAPGHYDSIICTALKGTKWKANLNPDEDMLWLNRLAQMLEKCTTDEFILVTTIDTHPDSPDAKSVYAKHRRWFEDWIKARYNHVRILRLPALVGKNLKKNVLFDLLNNAIVEVNPESEYQWYFLDRLWNDINRMRSMGLVDWTITTPPIDMEWIMTELFPDRLAITYDYLPIIRYNVCDPLMTHVMTEDEVKEGLRKFVEDYRATS